MQINAPLSFGSGFAGGALSNPVGAYQGAYMDYLKGTSQQYNNVLSGYQQTMADQRRRQKNVAAGYANAIGQTQAGQAQVAQGYDDLRRNVASGYRNLSDSVLGRIEGTNEANLQSIADQYGQSSARAGQQMVNRGLGNTTIQQSVQRGLDLDNAKAVTDSQNRFAQLQAGYAANIGQAGLAARAGIGQAGLGYRGQAVRDLAAQNQAALNYRGGAIQDSTDLANRQLNWMNSVNITPPNAKDYAALAGQMGAVQQGAPRFNPGGGAGGMPQQMGQWAPPGGGGGGGGGINIGNAWAENMPEENANQELQLAQFGPRFQRKPTAEPEYNDAYITSRIANLDPGAQQRMNAMRAGYGYATPEPPTMYGYSDQNPFFTGAY